MAGVAGVPVRVLCGPILKGLKPRFMLLSVLLMQMSSTSFAQV